MSSIPRHLFLLSLFGFPMLATCLHSTLQRLFVKKKKKAITVAMRYVVFTIHAQCNIERVQWMLASSRDIPSNVVLYRYSLSVPNYNDTVHKAKFQTQSPA